MNEIIENWSFQASNINGTLIHEKLYQIEEKSLKPSQILVLRKKNRKKTLHITVFRAECC